EICDDNDILLIFDEVQCGMGVTGKMWCCQHFDILPDLVAFGKKAQTCGVMAGPRLDEVKDNAFRLPSRLNSTWGGRLTDLVRSGDRSIRFRPALDITAEVVDEAMGLIRQYCRKRK